MEGACLLRTAIAESDTAFCDLYALQSLRNIFMEKRKK